MEKKKLTLDKSRKAVTTPNRCICETKNMARVQITVVEVLMDVNWVVSVIS